MSDKLTNCKTCGKEVSKTAKQCPHCGEDLPGISNKGCGTGCLVLIVIFIIISIGLYFFEPSDPVTPHENAWYSNGTLHDSKIAEWKTANPTNKLATSADWVLGASKKIKTEVKQSGTMETLKPYARELIICIDKTVDGHTSIDHQAAAETAEICMGLMGYLE